MFHLHLMATEEKILKYAKTEPFNKPIREPILKLLDLMSLQHSISGCHETE